MPVNGAGSVRFNCFQMFWGAIAFMLCESVGGELRIELQHEAVARDFRQHAGGSDGITTRVPFYERRLGKAKGLHLRAIHKGVLRHRLQLRERFIHRAMSGLQNIDLINRRRIRAGDGEADFGMAGQQVKETFALGFGELFGIVQGLPTVR